MSPAAESIFFSHIYYFSKKLSLAFVKTWFL